MLEKIKNKLFAKPKQDTSGNGLYASLEELMEMRKSIKRLQRYGKNTRASYNVGDVRSAFKGRGIELEEIRVYNYGDDVRDIDWRVTARKQEPYTKIYNEEKDREIYVLLDLSPTMVFGTRKELKSVTASKITSLLAWLSLNNNDRFGLCIFDGVETYSFKAKNHPSHILSLLKKVSDIGKAVLETKNIENFALDRSLSLLEKNIKSHATVFVISDFFAINDAEKKQLAVISKSSKVYCVNIMDVLEDLPPPPSEYLAENNGEKLIFNSRSRFFREEYKRYFAEKHIDLKDFCSKFSLHYLEIRTDLDVFSQLKL